jgi:cell division protein FtsW
MKESMSVRSRLVRPRSAPGARPGPVDSLFAVVVLALVCFGLVMLLSASMSEGLSRDDEPLYFFGKQFLFTLLGAGACLLFSLLNPRIYNKAWLALLAYAGTFGLLCLVLVPGIGSVSGGARRWFSFGGIQVQPSEVAKVLLVFCLAVYYSRVERLRASGGLERATRFRSFLASLLYEFFIPVTALGLCLVPMFLEPHVSGMVILTLVFAALVCVSGTRPRVLLVGVAILLVVAILLGALLMAILPSLLPYLPESLQKYTDLDYVVGRLTVFFHPELASTDLKWQTTQSIQAIGAGGLTGIGLGLGRQKFGYLPMSYNDYIFAIIGEELGLLGALVVLSLFLVLLVRGAIIARKSGSTFGYMLASGYTTLLVVQALLNIGVATNSIPPTGISLPFFSYGGSSNLMFLSAVGVILAVSRTTRTGAALATPEVNR